MQKNISIVIIFLLVSVSAIYGGLKKKSGTDFFLKDEINSLKEVPEYYYGIDTYYLDQNLSFDEELWNDITTGAVTASQTGAKEGFIPDIELGEDSKIKISGRKTVDLSINNKIFTEVDKDDVQTTGTIPRSQTDFIIDQQMQVKVEGQIKDRVFIDVEYDNTKEWDTKKNIKLQYRGTEDEIIQEVTLGEIDLSLPQTRFISFHKTLFGARADLQAGPVHYSGIISKKEGESKSSNFTGQSEMTTQMLENENYSKKFYNLSNVLPEEDFPLKNLEIYYDDKNKNTDDKNTTKKVEVTIDGETRTFYLDKLYYPDDYRIRDEKSSLIELENDYDDGYLVITYEDADGDVHGFDNFSENQIIYDVEEKFSEARMKSKYFLGEKGLSTEDTVINIFDSTDNDRIWIDNNEYYYIHIFGLDMDNNGNVDSRFINYEEGYLNFEIQREGKWIPNYKPFDLKKYLDESGNIITEKLPDHLDDIRSQIGDETFKEQIINRLDNSEIYEDYTNPDSDYSIYIKYFSPTQTFDLNQADIIPNSETVTVDNEEMVRGKDYTIDYMIGRIHFLNQDIIGPNSDIDINYEYRPIFSAKSKTLFGSRISYDKRDDFTVGATYIRDWMPEEDLDRAPQFGDETKSHTVYGTNFNYDYEIGDITTRIEGEIAKSRINPNTYGEVVMDNMENSRMEKSISLLEDSWKIASTPEGVMSTQRYVENIDPYSFFDVKRIDMKDIDPEIYSDEEKQIMHISQLPENSDEFFSYVYKISNRGNDYSNYKKIVVWYKLQNGSPTLHFDLGIINEDSDGDGVFDTEDKNDNKLLEKDEDTGYNFNINGNVYKIGANNNTLDDEDLDNDGVLRNKSEVVSYQLNLEGDGNWHKATINLDDYNSGDIGALNLVKHLRMWGEGFSGGNLEIAKLSITGTTWEIKKVEPETNEFEVSTISNYTDPDYEPLHKDELQNKDTKREDVSLELDFNMDTFVDGENYAYCEKDYGSRRDFTEYENIKVAYFPTTEIEGEFDLFVRFATDENNYYEITKTINETSPNRWNYINIDEIDQIEKNENVKKVGENANIKNIKYMYFGIKNSNPSSPYSGKLYLNDIKLVNPKIQQGTAKYLSMEMNYENYLSVNYDIEKKDGEYAMIDKNPSYENEFRQNLRSSFNFGEIFFKEQDLNINTSFSYTGSKTENNNFIDSGVDIDRLGKREYKRYRASTTMSKNNWPSFSYDFNYKRNDSTMSSDPNYTEQISHYTGLRYTFFDFKLLGISPVPEDIDIAVSEDLDRNFHKLDEYQDKNTSTKTNNWSLNLKWEFINDLESNWKYDLIEKWNLLDNNFQKQHRYFDFSNSFDKNIYNIIDLNLDYSTEVEEKWDYDDINTDVNYYSTDYDIDRNYSSRITFSLIDIMKKTGIFKNDFEIELNYENSTSRSYDLVDTNYDWTLLVGDFDAFEEDIDPVSENILDRYEIGYETDLFEIASFELGYEYSTENRTYRSTNSSETNKLIWPDIEVAIGNFEKVPLLKYVMGIMNQQNMTFSYEKTDTETESSNTLRKTVSKNPSFNWDIKWTNALETDMSVELDNEIRKIGENPPSETNNLRANFKLSHFVRSSRVIGVFLSDEKKRESTFLKLNYSFDYDEKWYKNQNNANYYKITNSLEGKYSLSNQLNISMSFDYNMYRTEESIKNYNEFGLGVGFEILF